MNPKNFETIAAERIVGLEMLRGCTGPALIKVLAKALDLVVERFHNELPLADVVNPIEQKFKRKNGNTGRYKFLKDYEVRKFVRGLDPEHLEFMTIDRLRDDISRHFGAARTPSRGALGRYLKAQRESSIVNTPLMEVDDVE